MGCGSGLGEGCGLWLGECVGCGSWLGECVWCLYQAYVRTTSQGNTRGLYTLKPKGTQEALNPKPLPLEYTGGFTPRTLYPLTPCSLPLPLLCPPAQVPPPYPYPCLCSALLLRCTLPTPTPASALPSCSGAPAGVPWVSCSPLVDVVLGGDMMKSTKHLVIDMLSWYPTLLYQVGHGPPRCCTR